MHACMRQQDQVDVLQDRWSEGSTAVMAGGVHASTATAAAVAAAVAL
jgi:hypothetical protein